MSIDSGSSRHPEFTHGTRMASTLVTKSHTAARVVALAISKDRISGLDAMHHAPKWLLYVAHKVCVCNMCMNKHHI